MVICSATGNEFVQESLEHKHGLFTQALLEGLSGKADANKDGAVYLHELDSRACKGDEQGPPAPGDWQTDEFALVSGGEAVTATRI